MSLPKLDIPPDLNLYDIYVAESIENEEARICVKSLRDTFRHFHIHRRNYRNTGNIVLRFSHWISEINDGVDITDADPEVKLIARMFEYYSGIAETRLNLLKR